MPESAHLFVTVGTDHHPFDRLVGWVDDWLRSTPDPPSCLIQSGTSSAPTHGRGVAYLGYREMERALDDARVVVSHGGPATIMLALQRGRRPIVVPRRGDLGEHVDDHQVAFARRLAREGEVDVAVTEEELHTFLTRAFEEQLVEQRVVGSGRPHVTETVQRFEHLVDALFTHSQRVRIPD
jgi:UDP-N-acetylglucosamine transferase subunit ALG13